MSTVQKEVAVCVCTFGDFRYWDFLAQRAVESIEKQTAPCQLIRIHGNSLSESRNEAARRVSQKYIIYVDADDWIEQDYVEKMLECDGDVRVPLVQQRLEDGQVGPIEAKNPTRLIDNNWVIISAMVEREMLLRLGGFRELPALEDWDLWLRFWIDGAKFVQSKALYHFHSRAGSRNAYSDMGRLSNEIRQQYLPIVRSLGL